MELEDVAEAIQSSVQYASNLLQGTAIPSDDKIQVIIRGLDFDNLKADQIRTFAAEDRRRHDGRYRRDF
jgi:transcriptional regulator with XRE-family HTH domain